MRRPKNQVATKAAQREVLANKVLEASPELKGLIDELDAPKASNVVLPSEKKQVEVVVKKPKALIRHRHAAKAVQKAQEAPTTPEPKAATPVAKKPKPQPTPKPKAPGFKLPEGAEGITKDGKLVGYVTTDENTTKPIYEAFNLDGKRIKMGLDRGKVEKEYLKAAAFEGN